ncbi:type II secretion system F family protein [Phenylobacterium sp.]|uniref:type II secretion system F family protein n=1 Tax=Phenylobacterium sp. TaxID=1871053 RepID=UPI0035B0208F
MTPADLVAALGPRPLPIALAVGAANFLTILMILRALSSRDVASGRARALLRRRQELRAERLQPRQRALARTPVDIATQLSRRLRLSGSREARSAADLLAQAGLRAPEATHVYLAARLLAPPLAGLAAYLLSPALSLPPGLSPQLAVIGAGLGLGYLLPQVLLRNLIQRRQARIQRVLPDALDLFVICAEAGLSLDAAVTRVAREIRPSGPDLADELGLCAIELGFLPDRREALAALARRVGTPQIRALVSTLVQTERYGTPLAQALRILAGEFRDARMMRAEEKAARLPATLTVPMITFILPPLFIVLIGPAIVQVLNSSF